MLLFLALIACDPESPDKGGTPTTDSGTTDSPPTDDTGTPTDDTGTTGGPVTLDGLCTDDVRWGSFAVESLEDYGYAAGSVADTVLPSAVLTRLQDDGECTIWKRENPFCEGGCAPDEACGLDGICVPYPVSQDLGTVTIDGLVQPVSMEPVTPGYSYFDTSLPNPPWVEGAVLTMHTAGPVFSPVVLHGVAPALLVPDTLAWTLSRDRAFTVTWDPPAGEVHTEVMVKIFIDLHGITPSKLECRFADDGSGEIPAAALAGLMDLGVTGFPEGEIERRSVDHAELDGGGCMELIATQSMALELDIEGYTPCNFDDECPEGTTCNELLQRCE